jgi:hypothetical protein
MEEYKSIACVDVLKLRRVAREVRWMVKDNINWNCSSSASWGRRVGKRFASLSQRKFAVVAKTWKENELSLL